MPAPSLFERLKRARIVQVLLVYLGASWAVLQIADILTDALSLPEWVMPVAILLLLVGLVIILATAWVQSLPGTTAAEEAGERPTDWQVAPADAVASLKAGRLPHLTWGRAVGGGAAALCLLFGGAGLYVLATGARAPGFGPEEAGANEAAAGIAVVPFNVTGEESLALWREGMVDLLSTNLDGMGGFRTIDSRTVMARWSEKVQDDAPDMRTVLEAAAATDARYALVGTLVGNPSGIRLSAEVFDLSTGKKVAEASEEGAAEDVLDLTSQLSVGIVRGLLQASGRDIVQSERLEALNTRSLPALRDYLAGEAAMRHANFAEASAAYERAVTKDSTFALAWYRLADAYGWLESIDSESGAKALAKVLAMQDRLPVRERMVAQASDAARRGNADYYATLRDAVQRYPDDPDIWYQFGDYIYHVASPVGVATEAQASDAFDRAIALDPGFGPYQVHPIEFAIARGDRVDAEARVAAYEKATESQDKGRTFEYNLAIPLFLGDSAEAAAAVVSSRDIDTGVLGRIRTELAGKTDRSDRLFDLEWANRDRAGMDHQWMLYILTLEGRLARFDRLLDTLDVSAANKGVAIGNAMGLWSTAKDLPHSRSVQPDLCERPVENSTCQMFLGWGFARSGDLTRARASAKILRDRVTAAPDSAAAAGRRNTLAVVEGAIAAAEGRSDQARDLMRPVARTLSLAGDLSRVSMADLEVAAGNIPEAQTYLHGELASFSRPYLTLVLARLHDQRGEIEDAEAVLPELPRPGASGGPRSSGARRGEGGAGAAGRIGVRPVNYRRTPCRAASRESRWPRRPPRRTCRRVGLPAPGGTQRRPIPAHPLRSP